MNSIIFVGVIAAAIVGYFVYHAVGKAKSYDPSTIKAEMKSEVNSAVDKAKGQVSGAVSDAEAKVVSKVDSVIGK